MGEGATQSSSGMIQGGIPKSLAIKQVTATPNGAFDFASGIPSLVKVAPPQKNEAVFNPEGSDYDYSTAISHGMKRGDDGHWGSRVELTEAESKAAGVPLGSGIMLKGATHETWDKALKGEEEAGFDVIKGTNGRYYSIPKNSLPTNKQGFVPLSNNKSVTYQKAVITGYHPEEDGGKIAYTRITGERPVRTGITAATNAKDIPAGSVLEILDVNGNPHYRFSDDTLGSAQYTASKKRGLSVPVIDLAVADAKAASNLTKLFGKGATRYRIIQDKDEIKQLKDQGLI